MVRGGMAWKLLIAALCVLANGFFVAVEFGLVKVRLSQLVTRGAKGDPRAEIAVGLVKRLDSYLSAAQLGITLASLALGWVGEPVVARLFELGLLALGFGDVPPGGESSLAQNPVLHGVAFTSAFVVITTIHIVVGEQAPKLFAIRQPESVALFTARPMRVFHLLTYPFLWVLSTLSEWTLRLLRVPNDTSEGAIGADEFRVIVASGQIEPTKRELIERVMQGTDKPVRAIMVPRVDMASLSLLDRPEQVMTVARTTGYSRLPVIEARDPDKVIGYVYVKDLILGEGLPTGGIKALRRDILFFPESRKVGDCLKDFQRTRIPIAIVVDEYGGTSGLVTVEDIIEEIVGEIQDELDSEQPRVQERADGSYVIDGMAAVTDLEPLGIELESVAGHDTVGGIVVSSLGRLARPGDVVRLGAFDATVEDVRRRRVTRVRLTRRAMSIAPEAASNEPPDDGSPG